MPGPQVASARSLARPRQLDLATSFATLHTQAHAQSQGYPRDLPRAACRLASSPVSQLSGHTAAQSHIYMEVDPLYSHQLPAQLCGAESSYQLSGDGQLVSSSSSQTSSGYSTAPSRDSGHRAASMYAETAEYETAGAGGALASNSQAPGPGRVYSISQACDSVQLHRQHSHRQKKPELVMGNILLQQSQREVL